MTTLAARWRAIGAPPRLMGIDLARALAIFGMIGAHVGDVPVLLWSDPETWAGIVDGRSSILFAAVAGISVALASGGSRRPSGAVLRSARLRLAGRALAVLAIGIALELLGTSIAIILAIYGALFLILLPFLGVRRRTLITCAAVIALVGPLLLAIVRALTLGGTGAGVEFLLTGTYPLTVWLPLMLAGLALGRSRLASVRTAVLLVVLGSALAVTGTLAGNTVNSAIGGETEGILGSGTSAVAAELPDAEADVSDMSCSSQPEGWVACFPDESIAWDAPYPEQFAALGGFDDVPITAFGIAPHSGGTFETLASGGFAFGVVGLCLLLARALRPVLVPLAAVGMMPLTVYTAHVVSVAVLISPFALAPELGEDGQFWLTSMGIAVLVCTAWILWRGSGPLEQLTARAARALDGSESPAVRERVSS